MSRMVVRMLTIVPESKAAKGSGAQKAQTRKSLAVADNLALQSSDVPYRLPSFANPNCLNNHWFEVNGEEFEYVDGTYYKRIKTLKAGDSFGEIAIQRKCLHKTNVKTESEVELAVLTKAAYESSLMKIADAIEQARVSFLCQLPIFKGYSRATVHRFFWDYLERVKFRRGQTVFTERDRAERAYIVHKGEFEMQKSLPRQKPLKAVHGGGRESSMPRAR